MDGNIFLGGNTIDQLSFYIFLGMVGATLYLLIDLDNGIRKSYKSPKKFDWCYFWVNNRRRLFLTPFFVYIVAVCGNGIPAVQEFLAQYPSVEFGYIVIGMLTDVIISKIKAKK